MNILCFSSSDWDGKWGSRQQVAMRWARRGHQVLFVEQMAGAEHFLRYPDLRHRRRKQHAMRKQEGRLWLFTPPMLLPGRYYLSPVNQLNARLVIPRLQRQMQTLSFMPDLLWVYKPEHAAIAAYWSNVPLVYHCIDEFTVGTSGRKRAKIVEQETDLLRRATIVFANSMLTYENKKHFNAHTYHIPSGADVAHFNKANDAQTAVSPYVAQLRSPILMFAGNINEKIDLTLLVNIAKERPQWTIVLIGQSYGNAARILSRYDNIHLLGKRPFADLPTFFRAADVCLLPYVDNESTLYRSPLKLYEYMATGIPIVSTPHPEVAEFKDIISIASPHNFVSAIEDILQNDTPRICKEQLNTAQLHSWDERINTMSEILQKYDLLY